MAVNVIEIICDDLSYYNGTYVVDKMPFVNSTFVTNGVRLARFRAYTPLCGPSRAQFNTGCRPENPLNLVIENKWQGAGGKATMEQTLPVAAQAAGYRTICIGKYLNFYGDRKDVAASTRVPPGWDWWQVCEEPGFLDWYQRWAFPGHDGSTTQHHFGTQNPQDYSTVVFGQQAIEAINSTPADMPLYMKFCPNAPHGPYTVETQYENLGGVTEVWQPPNYNVVNPEQPPYVRNHANYTGTPDDPAPQDNVMVNRVMRSVDDALDGIWNAMVDAGRTSGADSTLMILTSDNSRIFGEHKLKQKSVPYLASRQIGCWVYWPGNHGSTPRDENVLAQNIDIAPTIADCCGFSLGYTPDGASLKQDITAGISSTKTHIFGTMLARDTGEDVPLWRLVETDEGEVLVNYYPPVLLTDLDDIGQIEFYDRLGNVTTADPWELENLNTQGGAIATRQAELQAILDAEFEDEILRCYREAKFAATPNDSAGQSITIPIGSGQVVPAGRHIIGAAFIGSKGTGLTATVTDTNNNTYFVDVTDNLTGAATYIFSGKITTELTSSDSITINFSSNIAEERRAYAYSWSGLKSDQWLRATTAATTGTGTVVTSGLISAAKGGIVFAPINYGSQGGEFLDGSGWFMEDNYTGSKRKVAVQDQMIYLDGDYTVTGELTSTASWRIPLASYDMEGVEGPEPPPPDEAGRAVFTRRTASTLST